MTGAPDERFGYLLQFLRNPRELGSITPSSRFLARAILGQIDFRRPLRIVELGPGTGVFTRQIVRHLGPDGRLVALDTNAEFVAQLHGKLPDPRLTVLHESAERVCDVVAAQGWPSADVIVSGIPYLLLPRPVTAEIVQRSYDALDTGGLFVGYQYWPYVRPFLRVVFGHCRTRVVLRNLPPAVVMSCRKLPRA